MVIKKDTLDEWYVGFKYVSPDLESGETISAVDVSVDPSGLTLSGAGVITGSSVAQFITGGTSGAAYIMTFKTTISSGNIFIDRHTIKIK